MQTISQIYGQIKLAKEIPFIDELYLPNLKNGKSVEHKKHSNMEMPSWVDGPHLKTIKIMWTM